MPANTGKLSVRVGRWQPVTLRIVLLMGLFMKKCGCYDTTQGHSIQQWSEQVPKVVMCVVL